MERITSINPDRILWCCAEYGITPDELASVANISESSFERVMSRKDGLTFKQLSEIGKQFGKGVLFFLEPEPVDENTALTRQFRTLSNGKPKLSDKVKKLIELVESQRETYLNLRESLDESDYPKFTPPDLRGKTLSVAAKTAREWLGLTDINNFESYRKAVEDQGVLVFRSNGYNGSWQIPKNDPILGFTLYDSENPVIVVKKQPFEPQQVFTLMHELGHILLHKDSSIDDIADFQSRDAKEVEANAFAGYVLIPDSFLAKVKVSNMPVDVSRYDDWLKQFRDDWGVSGEVILRRLLDSGRLLQSQYLDYRQWKSQPHFDEAESGGSRKYRHREPRYIFGDRYVKTVLDALDQARITLVKASRYLDNISIEDLHRLERYYAGL